VDVNVVGTYILAYRYTDQAGNKSNVVTRTVKVAEPLLESAVDKRNTSQKKDHCPKGDFSPSYYDGECGSIPFPKEGSGKATGDFQ
jgi:hypothetical protein